MRPLPKAKTWITLLLGVGFLSLLATEVARETPQNVPRTTDPLRQNLARLQSVLGTAERHLDALREVNETEQVRLMQSTADLFKEYLLPHLAAEEAVLHPAADRQLPSTQGRLTVVLRHEHDILRRWVRDLESLANASMPDRHEFARRAERLLGLVEAHFEVDESVLYPILDRPALLSRTMPRGKP